MDGLLSDDGELIQRKDNWENLLKKNSTTKDEEEVNLDELYDVLDGSFDSEPNNDTEKENAPVEVDESRSQETPQETINKKLQLAVKEREAVWQKKGISFTFDKVDDWLKQSEYQNRKDLFDPTTEGHMVEIMYHKKMHVKRKSRKGRTECCNEEGESKSMTESETEMSDVSSNTSVDTAKYIRANQNHRNSKVKKTIIKKYIVTSKHYRRSDIRDRKASTPLQAISNERAENSSKKKQHRKTRHELNKRRRSYREPSDYRSSSSGSERSDDEPRTRKIPAAKLQRTQSEPANTKPTTRSTNKKLNVIQSNCSSKPSETSKAHEDSLSSHSRSRSSSIFNMSRKSWAHLPKKVVIYHPDLNTTNEERVRITNEDFEKAIGMEAAKDFFQAYQYEKEIDATSQLILEMPSTDDEPCSTDQDSEIDPLDYVELQVPKLSVVPIDQT